MIYILLPESSSIIFDFDGASRRVVYARMYGILYTHTFFFLRKLLVLIVALAAVCPMIRSYTAAVLLLQIEAAAVRSLQPAERAAAHVPVVAVPLPYLAVISRMYELLQHFLQGVVRKTNPTS